MLVLHPKASRLERWLLLAAHGVALFALTLAPIMPVISWLLAALVGYSLLYHTGVLPAARVARLQEIRIGAGQCRLATAQQQWFSAAPEIEFFSEWLIILRFDALLHSGTPATTTRVTHCTVHFLPDSLDAESDRQLRSYLRFRSG